jgi:hypothetical protein
MDRQLEAPVMDGAVNWPVRLLALTVLGYSLVDGIYQGLTSTEISKTILKDQSISVNSNTLEDLQVIPGIGPVIAERILDQRSLQPFTSPSDFENRVRGIGPTFMLNYGQWLTFDGMISTRLASQPPPSTQPIGFP